MFEFLSVNNLLSPSVSVTEKGIPDGLGRGYLSTASDLRALLVLPDDAETENAPDIRLGFTFIDDRSSFAQSVSWSAKAKYGFSGGGASARASMSQSYRRSLRSVDLVVTKSVHTDSSSAIRKYVWKQ
jgi:hypothetical protein